MPNIHGTEHHNQVALFNWAVLSTGQFPELEYMYAIPNQRGNARERRVMAEEGARKGIPDVHLPVARSGFHSLYIEMKVDKNYPTKDQKWWLLNLKGQGNFCAVCWEWTLAKDLIIAYLKENMPEEWLEPELLYLKPKKFN